MKNRFVALLLAALFCLLCGCSTRDYAPAGTVLVPKVTPGEKHQNPPEGRLDGWFISFKPVLGPKLKTYDAAAIQLILNVLSDADAARVPAQGVEFGNTLEIYDASERLMYSLTVSTDGQKLMLREGEELAHYLPEYVYYQLRWSLWEVAGSMDKHNLQWEPETQNIAIVQSRLGDMLCTVKAREMGYAEAYFVNYKLYGTALSEKDTVLKLYMTVAFAGYNVQEGQFVPVFKDVRPANITLQLTEEGYWAPIGYAQAADPTDYDSVRQVLPYDYAKTGMQDCEAGETMLADLARQALNYARTQGYSNMEVVTG